MAVFPEYELNTNFGLYYFTSFIGYPVLGYYLANKKFNISNAKMLIIGILIFAVSLGAYVYTDINQIDAGPLYQNIIHVLMPVGIFLAVRYIDELNYFKSLPDNLIGKFITSLSLCSYGMYFNHLILILYFEPFDFHTNKFMIPVLAFMVILSWLIIYIMGKIPYLKKVCGV